MNKTYRLSNQAKGAFMLALQKCILDQVDMIKILDSWEWEFVEDELFVKNPPVVDFGEGESSDADVSVPV